MSKRTKKQKLKQRQQREAVTVTCWDCLWKGSVRDIVYNGIDDRSECPNCTGTNYSKDGPGTKYVSPKASETLVERNLDASCIECGWWGPTNELTTNLKTAKDTCPECASEQIGYIPSETPQFLSSKPSKGKKSYPTYVPCYKSHKPLPMGNGLMIHGGSCLNPVFNGHDVYIGFDFGMKATSKSMPWTEGHEIKYEIRDGSVPKNTKLFIELVKWTAEQLVEGKSVHAGCIGGHGRTGMFFAALVAHMDVSDDPIQYVRDEYCHKVVESKEQVKFLVKHFGAKTAKGSKDYGSSKSGSSNKHQSSKTEYSSAAGTDWWQDEKNWNTGRGW